jgi:hypothetical protein
MEILNIEENKATQTIYTIQTSEGVVHYKEWMDERGKVIDSQLISKHGHDMSDEYNMVEEIIEMLNKLDNE